MVVDRELSVKRIRGSNLKELAAQATLHNVRQRGHAYIDLQEDGKNFIFFCVLCRAPCHNESTLFDHLEGNPHTRRYAAAKVTLYRRNPWPFSDGVLFFHTPIDEAQDKNSGFPVGPVTTGREIVLFEENNVRNLDGVQLSVFPNPNSNLTLVLRDQIKGFHHGRDDEHLSISGVLINGKISTLKARFIGFGQIGMRIYEKDNNNNTNNDNNKNSNNDNNTNNNRNRSNNDDNNITRIWCEWLGDGDSTLDEFNNLNCDFAVIVFPYEYDLGRKISTIDSDLQSLHNPYIETERVTYTNEKKSNLQTINVAKVSCRSDHCHTNSSGWKMDGTENALTYDRDDDILQSSGIISSKAGMRETQKQQQSTAERLCDLCQLRMLAGKDVATLFNVKTKSLACSSRNVNGAFHVFHTSCLIQWILLCEYRQWRTHSINREDGSVNKDATHIHKGKKRKQSSVKMVGVKLPLRTPLSSIVCIECQGTGMQIVDQLERPTISLSEIFWNKIQAIEAHKAWMINPESLEYCSTGLCFSSSDDNAEEKVLPRKMIQFYRAKDE